MEAVNDLLKILKINFLGICQFGIRDEMIVEDVSNIAGWEERFDEFKFNLGFVLEVRNNKREFHAVSKAIIFVCHNCLAVILIIEWMTFKEFCGKLIDSRSDDAIKNAIREFGAFKIVG